MKKYNYNKFKQGTTVQNYVKEFNLEERARKEKQRLAAIKIKKYIYKHQYFFIFFKIII